VEISKPVIATNWEEECRDEDTSNYTLGIRLPENEMATATPAGEKSIFNFVYIFGK
jgi:hypothetical protein